ncbi:MAG: S24 family peptidase [Gemmatimonadaceae bacterium]
MSPTIESGDILLVDVGEPGGIKGDGVYVLTVGDSVVVKRVAVKPTGRIAVSSDNVLYRHTAEEVERADARALHIVGKVIWVGGRI